MSQTFSVTWPFELLSVLGDVFAVQLENLLGASFYIALAHPSWAEAASELFKVRNCISGCTVLFLPGADMQAVSAPNLTCRLFSATSLTAFGRYPFLLTLRLLIRIDLDL